MRILVTGGAGFIGSHLCERLLLDGHNVIAIDNLSTGSLANLSSLETSTEFTFVEGSILNLQALIPLVSGVDYVFHLAAAVGVLNIMNNPLDSLLTNIRGTENVLMAAQSSKIPVFITSSSEVYGKNTSNSLRESDDRILGSPTTLRWSYSEAKAIDESLAYAYFVEQKLETRIVRFFNTVGPRQVGAYGMVVPRFVKSALANDPITIYGNGKQTRCFAHVYDVIDAVIAIAFADNTIGRVINIGNNAEISIFDLAQLIKERVGSKSPIEVISYMNAYGVEFEDILHRRPVLSKLERLTGFRTKWTLVKTLDDLIRTERKLL